MLTRTALTPRSIEAIEWARDHGGAWNYAHGKSLPWSASRSKLIRRLISMGLLADEYPGTITDAGRAHLNKIGL